MRVFAWLGRERDAAYREITRPWEARNSSISSRSQPGQSCLRQAEAFEHHIGNTRATCAIEGEAVLEGRRKLLIESPAQQVTGAMQARFDRLLPQAEEGCRFFDAHLFDHPHYEDRAEGVRQLVDGPFHQSADFSLCGSAFGIRIGRR